MKKYILLALALLTFVQITCQEINYKVEKPGKVYIGTPIRLYVQILTDPADSIFTSELDSLDIFLLQGDIIQTEEIIEDKKKIDQILTYQPFNTGEYTFPSIEFAVKTASGMQYLSTSEFQVNVLSTITDSSQAIMDIAEPVKINLGFWDYFLPLLLIVIIILIIRYALKFLRSKKVTAVESKPVDTRQAWEIALEMLNELERSDLLEKGDYLNYHYRLSLVLRTFIEYYYKVKAVEMTTSEIRAQLNLKDHQEKSFILDYLSSADRIKFAKYPSDLDSSRKAYSKLHAYIISYKDSNGSQTEETNV